MLVTTFKARYRLLQVIHIPQPGDLEPLGEVGSPGSPFTLPAEQTNFTITELTPNTVYLIEVYASTSKGSGDAAGQTNATDEDGNKRILYSILSLNEHIFFLQLHK